MSLSVVRDNIARAIKQFAFQHTPVSVTGNANETTFFSTVIPGGTLGPNGVLDTTSLFTFTNSAAAKIIRMRLGGQAFFSQGPSTTLSVHIKTMIRNRNNAAVQIGTPISFFSSFGHGNAALWNGSVDTSVDQTLTVTGQLATPTNTKSVTSLTRSGSIATATVTAHGYANGQSVLMAGANQTEYNGTFVISNVNANTFDYTVTGTPATPATGTITAALWDILTLESVMVEVKKS